MTEAENNEQREQLLIAFLDGELGPEDRALAESLIRDNPEYAQQVQQWRENGNAIRELPRLRLDEGFPARVLALTENVDADGSGVGIHSVSDSQPTDGVTTETTNSRIGLAAIATLAAMLLLTLFVFPSVVGPKVAVNQLEKKVAMVGLDANVPTKSAIEPSNDPANVGPGIARGGFSGVPLKSSLRGGNNSKPVEPIDLMSLTNRTAGVEQVLWINSNSQQAFADIEKVLTHNSIDVVRSDSGSADSNQNVLAPGDGVKALFVVATPIRMKQAINELSTDARHTVRAFPLPGINATDGQTSSANQAASARQIEPLDLSEQNSDAGEIARLDQWFGLAGEEDESKFIQFLIFVSMSPEPGTASNQ